MKQILFLLALALLTNSKIFSQQYEKDTRMQILKEDSNNMYNTDKITTIDLLKALELSGISINKYNLGVFDKEYDLAVIVDEFKEGKNVKSDTIMKANNLYVHFQPGQKDYYTDYIDQIKIFTKLADTTLTLSIETYAQGTRKIIDYKKYSKESFYNLRSYGETKWSLFEKIPLLVFASSWKDEKYGFQRFCGVTTLAKDNKDTDELLTSSPHYYVISYLINQPILKSK